MTERPSWINSVRRGVWHVRMGGMKQFRSFRARQRSEHGMLRLENVHGAQAGWTGRGSSRRLQFSPAELAQRPPRRQDLTVAVILDDFSAIAFGFEWNTFALGRDTWKEQLKSTVVDFLFVESAWAGNKGDWRYQITGESGPKEPFLDLMAWCRNRSIPTVLWNKEDPPHYSDFLAAAREFDVVFTSDSGMISAYVRDLGHSNVHVLPFAAQPAIHNPVRPRFGWRERDIAFAGMYFADKYPERRKQMDFLLTGALDASSKMDTGLEIYSRQLGGEDRYQFPYPISERVVGTLDYAQMLTAYKAYKVFLNVNSVVDSPSMCARRIFEITAAGAAVLSTPSEATRHFFEADELVTVETRAEAEQMSRALVRNPELADRLIHKAQRKIWAEHTYAHRAENVVQAVLPSRHCPVSRQNVSALVSTIRPHQLEHVFHTLGSQIDIDLELVLLTHGFDVSKKKIDELSEKYGLGQVVLLRGDSSLSLGECLNACVAASSGEVLTKMDDDDFYGPRYVSDLVHALGYSGSDIVGKQAHYMYLEASNATLLRFPEKEHRFTRMVMGPTLMGKRDIFTGRPFEAVSRGEDTGFLQSLVEEGGSVYAADRFNYFQHRRNHGHTWNVESEILLATADVKFFGLPAEHVTV
ncbi:glycosyltransferase family protein [Arthrobacter sp. TB 23]|uniref:glycosyltransferase family protein n=1 Tax=Arthrobacter sp. TB 23 TaxID=494419 RepID=UPI0003149C55|nr:glycosyltransferase [Arthrobacter sp. TB 23]